MIEPKQNINIGFIKRKLKWIIKTPLKLLEPLIRTTFKKAGYEIHRIHPPAQYKRKTIISKDGKLRGACLYVGCGWDYKEGYVGCDIRELPTVSIVCKAWEVSNHCTDVKEIYSRHMLEHLTLPQVEATLLDWKDVLEAGGIINIIVPNVDYHIKQWKRAVWNEETWKQKWSDARHAFAGFWGWQTDCDIETLEKSGEDAYWDVHKCGFNEEFFNFLLSRLGFSDIEFEIVDDFHLVAHARKPSR